jgi:hypothetical protein
MPNNLTLVNEINFHDCILNFINNNHMEVNNYDDMKHIYVKMLEAKYYFILKHELKIHMLLDLTYSLNHTPENREHVLDCLDIEENDSDDEEEENNDNINIRLENNR